MLGMFAAEAFAARSGEGSGVGDCFDISDDDGVELIALSWH